MQPHEMEQGSEPLVVSAPDLGAPYEEKEGKEFHAVVHKLAGKEASLQLLALPSSTSQPGIVLQNSRTGPGTKRGSCSQAKT